MKNRFFLPVLFFVIVSTMLTVVLYMQQDTREKPVYVASISDVLTTGANDEGFSKADIKREFVFPEDAGPHPGFRSEWWYYTGNLKSENGRLFGYQLTIFRQALSASAPISASTWRTNQIYMAHFAVTDIHSNRFYSYSRTVRGASELAGAQSNPYRVWLEDWTITGFFNSPTLRAREKDISIHLNLKSLKDIVPQGDQGLSQKSAGKGNASYYFSQTRLKTTGKIKIKNETFQITGLSWLDREWSTSSLGKSDTGWDWFSLQLDDNRELMLYVIRQKNGKISPFSSGTLVNPDGTIKHLTQQLYRVTPLEFWKSPETGIQYPIRWSIEIPTIDLRLEVKPYIKNQEHKHNFVYWEGAAQVTSPTTDGAGYVELVGYEKEND